MFGHGVRAVVAPSCSSDATLVNERYLDRIKCSIRLNFAQDHNTRANAK